LLEGVKVRTLRVNGWLVGGLVAGIFCLAGTMAVGQDLKLRQPPGLKTPTVEEDPHGPGEHHAQYEKAAGRFSGTVRFYPEAGGEPVAGRAWTESKMILGGRFLQVDFKGSSLDGNKRMGLGVYGFNEYTEKHSGYWIDGSSNTTFYGQGDCSHKGRAITLYGDGIDAASGAVIQKKVELDLQSFAQHTYKEFVAGAEGEWIPTMEILFVRLPDRDETSGQQAPKSDK
jgi:hypothetical protein